MANFAHPPVGAQRVRFSWPRHTHTHTHRGRWMVINGAAFPFPVPFERFPVSIAVHMTLYYTCSYLTIDWVRRRPPIRGAAPVVSARTDTHRRHVRPTFERIAAPVLLSNALHNIIGRGALRCATTREPKLFRRPLGPPTRFPIARTVQRTATVHLTARALGGLYQIAGSKVEMSNFWSTMFMLFLNACLAAGSDVRPAYFSSLPRSFVTFCLYFSRSEYNKRAQVFGRLSISILISIRNILSYCRWTNKINRGWAIWYICLYAVIDENNFIKYIIRNNLTVISNLQENSGVSCHFFFLSFKISHSSLWL